MKKIAVLLMLIFGSSLRAISTVMNHRLVTSSPLLYKQDDYSSKNLSIEFQPFVSQMFDPAHVLSNVSLTGTSNISLNQQGLGDINSAWLYLGSSNAELNYSSHILLEPFQQLYGLQFHCYELVEHFFVDIRTALLQSKSGVTLTENGGFGGGIDNNYGTVMYDAYDAWTDNEFQYGKIGNRNEIVGFDNIQIMMGATGQVPTHAAARTKIFVAGFTLLEVPTGAGTTAQWLLEPQVGTNHWAFGGGFDAMLVGNHGYNFVLGGNFRHFIANWQMRSFDLTDNGPWSRYLLVQELSTLNNEISIGLPGINIFTQQALIQGRNQINFYSRLQKDFGGGFIEFGYNLFYTQAESIRKVTSIPSGYGIFAMGSGGGTTTSSSALISQANPTQDFTPVELVTADLNLASGCAGQWLSNTIALRLQRTQDVYTYGFGASVDLARTAQAVSSWAAWFNFEILLQ